MAAVYKTVSKKNARRAEAEEESDVDMEDFIADADDTSDSEEEDEQEQEDEKIMSSAQKQLASGMMPKTRVLMLTSRGVTYRYVFLFQVRKKKKR